MNIIANLSAIFELNNNIFFLKFHKIFCQITFEKVTKTSYPLDFCAKNTEYLSNYYFGVCLSMDSFSNIWKNIFILYKFGVAMELKYTIYETYLKYIPNK